METILAMILAAVTIAYVGYPLLKAQPGEAVEEVPEEETVEDELAVQKESTYAAISELDFDHAMGNLSDADHQELRERYKLRALALMKQADEVEKATRAAQPTARPAARATSPAGTAPRAFCPSCGAKLATGDRFCSSCGKPFASVCPSCGENYDPSDAFCAACGAKL